MTGSIYLLATRPKFLTASAAPVLVGSGLGYAMTGVLHWDLFVLSLLAMMALHSGANVINDYFDHLSGNDWVNTNATPFSGGRRFIQEGVLSPKATLITGLTFLGIGAVLGGVIVWLTRSILVLILGLAGLLGGYFYTARPFQLGYRCLGEGVIALLFGLLPVYGSYSLQSPTLGLIPLLPALVVSGLIFLIILINEFPDREADALVGKRTLVVRLGVAKGQIIYRSVLVSTFVTAGGMLFEARTRLAGVCYLCLIPLAVSAFRAANTRDLSTRGLFRANGLTVLLHTLGSLALAMGLVVAHWLR